MKRKKSWLEGAKSSRLKLEGEEVEKERKKIDGQEEDARAKRIRSADPGRAMPFFSPPTRPRQNVQGAH